MEQSALHRQYISC